MEVVNEFISRYRREMDFFTEAARLAAATLEEALRSAGIRAIVTHRAKSPARLEDKCLKRARTRTYSSVDDIYADIIDLAGVRVALYFPGERDQVGRLVEQLFAPLGSPKVFPEGGHGGKRFSGYSAVHYRVRLREDALSEADRRYSDAMIEVQVASVLMHAWSEVEHDLVYKPLDGELSTAELAILDGLNGLVLSGEVSLELLQQAGEERVRQADRRFANHYDLAAFLLKEVQDVLESPEGEAGVGRVDLLAQFLQALDLDRPESVQPYLTELHGEWERRPLAEQVADAILAEDGSRYDAWQEVRRQSAPQADAGDAGALAALHQAIGYFMSQWIELERAVEELAPESPDRRLSFGATARLLSKSGRLSVDEVFELEQMRRLRNSLVHGVEVPDPDYLRDAGDRIQSVVRLLRERF